MAISKGYWDQVKDQMNVEEKDRRKKGERALVVGLCPRENSFC